MLSIMIIEIGNAEEICKALAFKGSGYLFETTFEKEVYSDLVGERCVLVGNMIHGAFNAQYNVLRRKGIVLLKLIMKQ